MNAERWAKIKPIFNAAADQPARDRAAFIRLHCDGDETLVLEIESLLAAHDQAQSFIETPALDCEPVEFDSTDHAGKLLGPYRIIGKIGAGGMGSVYLAARADQSFEKQVAIKLIRGGLGADFLVQRFLAERQMLAGLEHPNIARLMDGGTTEDGLPYLVMEHVEGKPLTQYCNENDLSTRERLKIFRSVCAAVHYAHQNLIVHRDIKPGNILVTPAGEPKLLDFGIAKFLSPEVDGNQTTIFGRMMTPDYASPEQARGETITTASDIYSLGVLLYELLTGRRPYKLAGSSPIEIARLICEHEPSKPSTALEPTKSTRDVDADTGFTGAQRDAARTPGSHPDRLRRQLEGDLDNIVLKALRKEAKERYASVQELSDDIGRHLEGMPVIARPATFTYRTNKFIRRHKWGVGSAAVIALSLIAATSITSWEAVIAKRERAKAERRFNDVRRLADSFMFDIHDEIRDLPGSTRARQRLVTTAEEYLDGLAKEAEGNIDLQRELAAAYERLGDVQGGKMDANLGDTNRALESYGKGVAILKAIASGDRIDPGDAVSLAHLELRTGVMLRGMGRLPDAEASYRAATERLEAVVASGRAQEDIRGGLGDSYQKLAEVQQSLGLGELARLSIEKSIDHDEAFCREHPDNSEGQLRLAAAYYVNSLALGEHGNHQQALARSRQARAIQEALLQNDPLNQRCVRGLLFSLSAESLHLQALGELREAVEVMRHGVDIAEQMLRRDPRDHWAQVAVTVAYSQLGRWLIRAGDHTAALASLQKGRNIGVRVEAEDPKNGFVRNEIAIIDCNLGFALLARGTSAARQEACRAFARGLQTLRLMQAEGPLTAESASAIHDVEAEIARCEGH